MGHQFKIGEIKRESARGEGRVQHLQFNDHRRLAAIRIPKRNPYRRFCDESAAHTSTDKNSDGTSRGLVEEHQQSGLYS